LLDKTLNTFSLDGHVSWYVALISACESFPKLRHRLLYFLQSYVWFVDKFRLGYLNNNGGDVGRPAQTTFGARGKIFLGAPSAPSRKKHTKTAQNLHIFNSTIR
jgi:hypothetical protein